MTVLTFFVFLLAISTFAGFVGSLTGLGGGMIIVPALVLIFKVEIHYAMGAALLSILAASTSATINNLKNDFIHLKIGMLMVSTSVIGALFGAMLVSLISKNLIAIFFSAFLLFSVCLTLKKPRLQKEVFLVKNQSNTYLQGFYLENGKMKFYQANHIVLALVVTGIGGILSGLLGIGGGAVKVIAMDQLLGLPYKVSTTTSNFMMGLTATAGIGVYLNAGYINPYLASPVILGVTVGAWLGALLLPHIHVYLLRGLFCLLMTGIAIEMLYRAVTGTL